MSYKRQSLLVNDTICNRLILATFEDLNSPSWQRICLIRKRHSILPMKRYFVEQNPTWVLPRVRFYGKYWSIHNITLNIIYYFLLRSYCIFHSIVLYLKLLLGNALCEHDQIDIMNEDCDKNVTGKRQTFNNNDNSSSKYIEHHNIHIFYRKFFYNLFWKWSLIV